MGRIHIVIDDELEKELRKVLPHKKGSLSKFIEEAIREKLAKLKKEQLGK